MTDLNFESYQGELQRMTDLNFESYQSELHEIQQNFSVWGTSKALPTLALGLAGETGEVCEILKRYFREGIEPNEQQLTKELGDIVAYVTLLAIFYNIPLRTIFEVNLAKLTDRKERGVLEGKGNNR